MGVGLLLKPWGGVWLKYWWEPQYCWWKKSGEKTTWDGGIKPNVNNGKKLPTSTGAGFLPSQYHGNILTINCPFIIPLIRPAISWEKTWHLGGLGPWCSNQQPSVLHKFHDVTKTDIADLVLSNKTPFHPQFRWLKQLGILEDFSTGVAPQTLISSTLFHYFDFPPLRKTSWWFQPIWKIWSSKWESSTNFGAKIENIWVATT